MWRQSRQRSDVSASQGPPEPPEGGRGAWKGFSLRASRRNRRHPHLDFGLATS